MTTKVTIHYIHNTGLLSGWTIACMPNVSLNVMRSNDPRAVSCEKCKDTNVFKDHMASINASEAGRG